MNFGYLYSCILGDDGTLKRFPCKALKILLSLVSGVGVMESNCVEEPSSHLHSTCNVDPGLINPMVV